MKVVLREDVEKLGKRGDVVKVARVRKDFEAVARSLSGLSFAVARRVGENDALFGSVTAQDIAELIAAKGIEVDKRKIMLDEPIKRLGPHEVTVKLHKDVASVIRVEVVKEEE